MRVKVTNTCDTSEASSVVIGILTRAQEELRALSNKKFNYWQVSELLVQINFLRDSMNNIAHNLDDAVSITSGWLDVILDVAQDSNQEFESTVQEQEENTDEQEKDI